MAGSMFFSLKGKIYGGERIMLGRFLAGLSHRQTELYGAWKGGCRREGTDWWLIAWLVIRQKNRSAVEILLLWSLYDHYTIIIVTMFLMLMMMMMIMLMLMMMMMMMMSMITIIVIFVLWTSTFSCLTVLWAGDVDLRGPPLYSNGQRLYYHPVISHSYGTWWFTLLYPLKTDDFPIYRS